MSYYYYLKINPNRINSKNYKEKIIEEFLIMRGDKTAICPCCKKRESSSSYCKRVLITMYGTVYNIVEGELDIEKLRKFLDMIKEVMENRRQECRRKERIEKRRMVKRIKRIKRGGERKE